MNWKLVTKYALYLLLTQFAIGFVEGLFTPTSLSENAVFGYFLAGVAASLLASAALFFALSARHHQGRWVRAVVVLLVYSVLSLALDQLMPIWLDSGPAVLVVVGWLGVTVGAFVGTGAGALFPSRAAIAARQAPRQDA